jgi:hypothetical protein
MSVQEYLLRLMTGAFLLGCMSYVQIAELVVFCRWALPGAGAMHLYTIVMA